MHDSCMECDRPMRADAFKCGFCGWVRPATSVGQIDTIPCAHSSCGEPATCCVQTHTGWKNLCILHYAQAPQQEADAYCREHGLDTTDKKIAHCKALFRVPRDPKAWLARQRAKIDLDTGEVDI